MYQCLMVRFVVGHLLLVLLAPQLEARLEVIFVALWHAYLLVARVSAAVVGHELLGELELSERRVVVKLLRRALVRDRQSLWLSNWI